MSNYIYKNCTDIWIGNEQIYTHLSLSKLLKMSNINPKDRVSFTKE